MKLITSLLFFLTCFNLHSQTSCNNWLYLPSYGSFVTVGDLDITGDQLTVEAMVNSINLGKNKTKPGHLVSKHTYSENVNYSLFISACELTTSITGYIALGDNCEIYENNTYHVAMVYNGKTLRFYRNGELIEEKECRGKMVTNDLETTIGQVAGNLRPQNNQVNGYVNEVRIWNIARTQNEIRNFMNKPLPSPKTISGLKGYYTFDDLTNKQGNSNYDGKIQGKAKINQTNINCDLSFNNNIKIFAAGKTTFCEGDSVRLELEKGYKYDWFRNEELIKGEQGNSIKVYKSGTYTAKQIDGSCSKFSDPVIVNVINFPSKKISASDTVFKNGNKITLTASAENVTYTWNNNSKEKVLSADLPGSYFVTLDNQGCKINSDTIVLKKQNLNDFVSYKVRKNEVLKVIPVKDSATINLDFLDYRTLDGDIISVYVNEKEILSNQLLSKKPLTVKVVVNKMNPIVEVKIVAENLGTIPPNTAMMQYKLNGKLYETQIVSSGQKNAIVKFMIK